MVMDMKKLMGRVDCLQQYSWNMEYDGTMKLSKGEDTNMWNSLPNPQTAFLGPQLWEKKISMSNIDQDFKYWQGYRGWNSDLSQQSCQNGGQYPVGGGQHQIQQGFESAVNQLHDWQAACNPPKLEPSKHLDTMVSGQSGGGLHTPSPPAPTQHHQKREDKQDDVDFKVSEDDLALAIVPGAEFDPKTRSFSAEELKPQPIIRKRPKNFTADSEKDDKYWEKRAKNNIAARRSREARRLKENQIALRAAYLEKQNMHLRITLKKLNIENAHIKVNVDHLLAKIVEKQKSLEASGHHNTNNLTNNTSPCQIPAN